MATDGDLIARLLVWASMGAVTGRSRDDHRWGGCGAVETVSEHGGNSFGPTQSGGRVGDRTMASRRIRDPGPSTLAGRLSGPRVSRPLVTGTGTVSACWAR